MRKIKVAAIQMRCSKELNKNLRKAEQGVREAAAKGANVILLPQPHGLPALLFLNFYLTLYCNAFELQQP